MSNVFKLVDYETVKIQNSTFVGYS